MQIRKAETKDIPQLQKLLLQVELVHHEGRPDLFQNGARKYTEEQLESMLQQEDRPILVAADEKDVVCGYAFCILQVTENDQVLCDRRTLYLDDLCVEENCRGQHIGKLLYEAVLQLAKQMQCADVTLHVWNCNASAMRFYESCGLRPRLVCMEKIL